MRRDELRSLAHAKLNDARLLVAHNRASNAYYIAGYAVEFGLKACIARHIAANTIPDKEFIRNVYTHNFITLVGLAGLTSELKRNLAIDANFAVNWAIVNEWVPDSRYRSFTLFEAQTLVGAINGTPNGVFSWIARFW